MRLVKGCTYVIFSFVFAGCNFTYENNTNHTAALEELRKETDSLKMELSKLKKEQNKKDSLENTSFQKMPDVKDSISEKKIIPKKKTQERENAPKQTVHAKKADTIYYFYTNTKKISVKIDPDPRYGKKKIRFYNPKGEVTFEQEDVRKSYSVSTDIKEFHPNGAVKRIVIHFNPDGSMHWYETNMTFDTDNTPLWKEEITYPLTLDNMMNNKWYWDKKQSQWIRQEASVEY